MNVTLSKRFRFEAAHLLPKLPETHKCRRLHGHSFEVEIAVEGPLDPELGWLIDYAEIKEAMRPILAEVDHHYLNDVKGLENPTSEVIAIWIWNRLIASLPMLSRVTVFETCTSRCDYDGR